MYAQFIHGAMCSDTKQGRQAGLASDQATASVGNAVMRYLIQFSQQHESFWLPELDTLLELNGVDPAAAYDHDVAWAVVSRGHKVRRPLAANMMAKGK